MPAIGSTATRLQWNAQVWPAYLWNQTAGSQPVEKGVTRPAMDKPHVTGIKVGQDRLRTVCA